MDKYSSFGLYIGGVKASITAYVDPHMASGEVMILRLPEWDAFLMSVGRTSYPERETVAFVASELKNQPDRRFVVVRVSSSTVRETRVVPKRMAESQTNRHGV